MITPAVIIPQDPIFKGDTWPGFPAVTLRINDALPDGQIDSVEMIFFEAERGPDAPALTLASPDEITITSAANWEIEIPPQALALAAGEWTFRLRVTDTNNILKTYGTGTLQIL